jgi:predicted transcriptional regulator
MQTVEAVIDKMGNVKLLANIRLSEDRRALLTILDEEPQESSESKKQKLFAAFEKLTEKDIFPEIEDPAEWQRKLRDEWE